MRINIAIAAATLSLLCHGQRSAEQEFLAALSTAKAGQLDSARVQVDRSLTMDAANAKAHKLSGDLYQRAGDHVAALAAYKRAEDLDPNDHRLYISRGALRISSGQYKTALKDCERAIELDPTDPDGFYNRACALYLGGNTEGAEKDAAKAVKLKPDHADALYLRGVTKGDLYQEEAGLADIDAALRLKPSIPGGLMSMAVLLYEAKRYEEAIEKFNEVLATDTAELAAAHFYRGDSYYQLDNKEKACEDFVISAKLGDRDASFIKKNYCDTDLTKIPRKPVKGKRKTVIEF
jgi:tetratricopeptide (TPR) repeat protein